MKIKRRTDIEIDPVFAVGGDAGVAGDRGIQGERGERGVDGVAGERGVDGRSFNPRGEYRSGQVYQPLDVVRANGSSFVCTAETTAAPPSKAWQLLVRDGEDGEDGIGQRGPRGLAGDSAATDLTLVFDDTARAGQVVALSCPNHCRLANGLSYTRCSNILGVAIADTLAGSTGKVRTVGLLKLRDWTLVTGSATLQPRAYYSFIGRGMLTTSAEPENTAIKWTLGSAISEDTLLLLPVGNIYVRETSPITAPCLSALPKGTPVYLASDTHVDAADMVDNWEVAGVLVEDTGTDATYKQRATVTKSDWSDVLESEDTLLTPSTQYYLSDTPGKLTTDDVDRLFIGKASSPTAMKVNVGDSTPNHYLTV